MIKFKCSGCQKAIGVDEKYAGRLIKCPACQNATRVPAAATDVGAGQATPAPPIAQSATAQTTAHVPKASVNPTCPSCKSELFNPSDTLCGICGHQLEQAPLPPRPAASIPIAAPIASPVPSGVPVNPAIASYENPALPKAGVAGVAGAYDPTVGAPMKQEVTTGRSVGAWFAAVGVGLFLALVWGVVASFFGAGAQVFAWVIGAIVGCLAGLIARNPSMKFCLATTLGALLCMLFGRVVSAWVIMIAVSTMSSVQDFGNSLIPDTAVSIGVLEQMNADGELEGAEKDVAEMKIEAFLSNQSVFEIPKYDEIELETEIDLDKKVREIIREMSSDEKEAMREKVRAGHPEWMEQSWHALAILDSMVAGEEIDDEILLAHAVANLRSLDGEHDEDYHQDSTQQEKTDREEQLRILVQEKYEAMSPEQRVEAIKNARLNHLSWTPVRSEYLAMLDAMYESGDIPKELKPIAKSTINLELDFSYDDAFEDFSDPDRDAEIEKRDKQRIELRKLVNAEVLKLEPEEVEQLVAATQEKYPNWKPVAGLEVVDELNDNFDDFISRFESDGTFWDSLKTRFRTLDFVWIGLGMISAFAIAFTLGQSGKKETTK